METGRCFLLGDLTPSSGAVLPSLRDEGQEHSPSGEP